MPDQFRTIESIVVEPIPIVISRVLTDKRPKSVKTEEAKINLIPLDI